MREVAFHLERDADMCGLRHRTDRLALASVICKAATVRVPAAAIDGARQDPHHAHHDRHCAH